MSKIEATCSWKEVPLGCHTPQPGSSADFKTGDWKTMKPVTDPEKCIYCALCWIYCPEGCIHDKGPEAEYYESDLEYCKGCGICAQECPKDAITMEED
jgi:pyruvate ferredoxin oxidoreductase delta subunit